MKREFSHYKHWEDFKAGMYGLPSVTDETATVELAAKLLKYPDGFFKVASEMINEWPVSALVNLSNRSRNRQAWIGQASCAFAFKSAEHQTKLAWHTLTIEQQDAANSVADELIEIWDSAHA